MKLERTSVYENLSGKEQEYYNYTIIAEAFKHYNVICLPLSLDDDGPDFVAHNSKTRENINVQQKGRFWISKRYEGQDLWMVFVKDGSVYFYNHDKVVNAMKNSSHAHKLETASYVDGKGWHTANLSNWIVDFIEKDLIIKL